MLFSTLLILFGLGLLVVGGDLLVRGASSIAEDAGVSPLFIGLTIVAFGTSAPELSVNILAALNGNTDISFGNIVGSNIANIGLILGFCACLRPLVVEGIILTREIPMMLLATLAVVILASDALLVGRISVLDRSDGLIFLLLFCVFFYYSVGDVVGKKDDDPLMKELEDFGSSGLHETLWDIGLFVGGLALLMIGGKFAVDGAVSVAEGLGVPRVVIGLTIIGVGTSLPELVASGVATWRGKTEIAIGNVIGSNIFNLLLVFGICSTITPLPIPEKGGTQDLAVMLLMSLLVFPLCLSFKRTLVRVEGAILLAIFVSYISWRVIGSIA